MIDAKGLFWDQANWGPGYEISFEMFIHSYGVGNSKGYSWVFVVGNKNANSKNGYGQPAIWLHKNGYLEIYHYQSEAQHKTDVTGLAVPLKTWTKVNIKSHKDNTVRFNTYIWTLSISDYREHQE